MLRVRHLEIERRGGWKDCGSGDGERNDEAAHSEGNANEEKDRLLRFEVLAEVPRDPNEPKPEPPKKGTTKKKKKK